MLTKVRFAGRFGARGMHRACEAQVARSLIWRTLARDMMRSECLQGVAFCTSLVHLRSLLVLAEAVISKGTLTDARDQTAVLISRCVEMQNLRPGRNSPHLRAACKFRAVRRPLALFRSAHGAFPDMLLQRWHVFTDCLPT